MNQINQAFTENLQQVSQKKKKNNKKKNRK